MPSLTMCLPFAVFQEAEIVWGKSKSITTHTETQPCTIWKPMWKRCNVKKKAMTEEWILGLYPDFAVTGRVKLGKIHNFSHFCVWEWGLESQLRIVVWIKGLYVKPKHSTCGVESLLDFFYIDSPPPLVRSLWVTIANG